MASVPSLHHIAGRTLASAAQEVFLNARRADPARALADITASIAAITLSETGTPRVDCDILPEHLQWVTSLPTLPCNSAELLLQAIDGTRITADEVALIVKNLPKDMTTLNLLHLPCGKIETHSLPVTLRNVHLRGISDLQLEELCNRCPQIQNLEIRYGSITTLAPTKHLTQLTTLTSYATRSLQTALSKSSSLERLCLPMCTALQDVPDLDAFPRLRKLHIHHARSLRVAPWIPEDHPIEEYDIRFCNQVLSLPKVCGPNLTTFRVIGASGVWQRLDFALCPKLTDVDLSFTKIIFRTKGLNGTNLPKLFSLNLTGTWIEKSEARRIPRWVFTRGL